MQLSVVIPTHQRPESLRQLLLSLADQEYACDSLEVHVVSNFAVDGSRMVVDEISDRLPLLKWHAVGVKGSNRARNLGLRAATGKVILFLDDDCFVPHRYFLRDLLNAHNEHPEAVAIGGAYFSSSEANAVDKAYTHISTSWLARRTEDKDQSVNLVGGNVSYKKAYLDEMKMKFNEEIAFGGAETDLHLRLYRAGGKLVFLPQLSVEHRPDLNGRQLMHKGFLQGLAAHIRLQNDLVVPTRRPQEALSYTTSREEKFWAGAFELSFRLGGRFGSWSNGKKPSADRVLLFLMSYFVRTLVQSAKNQLKRTALLKSFSMGKRQLQVEMPLSRFYFLPVSGECPKECAYSAKLGCRKDGGNFNSELKKAKDYGFREILLPCNIYFQNNRFEIVKQIVKAGLRPFVLVNGDEKAAISPEHLSDLASAGCEFHVLLGSDSRYQQELVERLTIEQKDISATYFHRGWHEGLSILKNAPAKLVQRIHYLFPSAGDVWHPQPSCFEIHRFLEKIVKFRPRASSLQIRGAAGYWRVDRGSQAQPEPWPELEPKIEIGRPSPSILFSIIIPTFDSSEHLIKILRSLAAQSLSRDQYEVIIVDDGSRDNSLPAVSDAIANGLNLEFYFRYFYWPRPEGQLHFRAGLVRNFGVSRSTGAYLCFLDSDILVAPDYLEDLNSRFRQSDVIQARRNMLTQEASATAMQYKQFTNNDTYLDSDYWENFKATETWSQIHHHWKYTCTYALSLRRELFLRAGWFSPEYFSYGFEDVDLGYRCAKLGARFHLNQKAVYHLYPSRNELNFHFDENERTKALTLSSRVLFRNQLDPEIFNEFYPAYYQPLKGELKILASRLYWRLYGTISRTRGRLSWRHLVWCMHRMNLFKPYHFLHFQYRKRIRGDYKEMEA